MLRLSLYVLVAPSLFSCLPLPGSLLICLPSQGSHLYSYKVLCFPSDDSVWRSRPIQYFREMPKTAAGENRLTAIPLAICEQCLPHLIARKTNWSWQQYDNPQYIDALRFISEDGRVGSIGLCNFDTEHLEAVLESGIAVHTNQVQVRNSLHFCSIGPRNNWWI